MRDYKEESRARVGTAVLRVFNDCGTNIALEVYKGGFAALTIALVTFIGREATRDYFDQITGEIKPQRSKPYLATRDGVVA